MAWWVPTWEGFGERSTEDNRRLREELLERGEFDGCLAFRAGECVGGCQVGARDRWTKLVAEHGLAPDPQAFALPCFFVPAAERRSGDARALLAGILEGLEARGVHRLEAFPRSEIDLESAELSTGPRSLFAVQGFREPAGSGRRILMVRELPGG